MEETESREKTTKLECYLLSSLEQNSKSKNWGKNEIESKEWQGAWRNIDKLENATSQLSSHQFQNGLQCITKVKGSSLIQPEELSSENILTDLYLIEQKENYSREIADIFYNKIEERLKQKLTEPMKAVLYSATSGYVGTILISRSASHKVYLLFVFGLGEKIKPNKDEELFTQSKEKVLLRQKIFKKWELEEIKLIFKKQTGDIDSGLEIIFYNGRSIYLTFESVEKRDLFGTKLVRLRGQWCRGLKYEGTLNPARSFEKRKETEKWVKWRQSTLDYILSINMFSNRSFHNLNIYPMFPAPSLLDKRTINSQDSSSYSASILPGVRVHSSLDNSMELLYKLKGLQNSIPRSHDEHEYNANIPEIYSLPEIYQNQENDVHAKKEGKKDKINPYSHQTVVQLREALEASQSSVCNWIDQTFRTQIQQEKCIELFKQKHQERLQKIKDKPYMLWDAIALPKLYDQKEILNSKIIKIETTSISPTEFSFTLIGIDGTLITGSINYANKDTIQLLATIRERKLYENNCFLLNTHILQIDPGLEYSFPLAVLSKHKFKYIAQGGYWNGSIQLTPIDLVEKPTIILNYHTSCVTCLAVDKEERVAIAGTKEGDCIVYRIGDDMFWNPMSTLIDHGSEISFIHISDEMQLFITASTDGTANLYNLSAIPKLIRTFRPQKNKHGIPLNCV